MPIHTEPLFMVVVAMMPAMLGDHDASGMPAANWQPRIRIAIEFCTTAELLTPISIASVTNLAAHLSRRGLH